MHAPLWCKSNFSFLEGASHPEELVEEAHRLGIGSLALTDRDGVYGMVRAHVKARDLGVQLICGAQISVAAPGQRWSIRRSRRSIYTTPSAAAAVPAGAMRPTRCRRPSR